LKRSSSTCWSPTHLAPSTLFVSRQAALLLLLLFLLLLLSKAKQIAAK
jgi:hypothetical protein